MEYLILGLGLVAMLHFVYEAIIAPTLRLQKKYEAFTLRDELRRLAADPSKRISDREFHAVQSTLNGLVRVVDFVDIVALAQARIAIDNSAELRSRLEARHKMILESRCDELKALDFKAAKTIFRSARINSAGAWFVFSPLFLVADAYKKWRSLSSRLVSMTDYDRAQVFSRARFAEVGIPR